MQKIKGKKRRTGWGILFRHLFVYRKEVIALSILGILSAIANGTTPYVIGKFFDGIITPVAIEMYGRSFQLWAILISLFIFLQLFADIVDWFHSKKEVMLRNEVFASYRANSVTQLLYFPLSFYKSNNFGKTSENIFRAADGLSSIIGEIVVRLFPQFLSIAIGLSIAFYINIFLAIILVVGVVLYTISLTKMTKNIGALMQAGSRGWSTAHGMAYETLSNIEIVKDFTTEKREELNIKNAYIKKAAVKWAKVELKWNQMNFIQKIIVTITRSAIFVFSVYLIQGGVITFGELIAFNGYAMMFFGPFVILGQNWQSVQNGIVALEEMDKLLETSPEKYIPKKVIKTHIDGSIEFKNVYFKYKDNKEDTLKGVNFKVKKGEVVALVGESGVGKSTVTSLLSAFYFPRKGSIEVDGVNIKNIKLNELRQAIAVVPQEISLFNDTVLANIKYGNFNSSYDEIKMAAHDAYADVFIDTFPKKYNQVVGNRGIKLSVGQKQRIAIARAILRNPKILILDEPTSALDSTTELFINKSFEKLMKGRTTVIVAHRLSTVRKADKILVFQGGKIVENGSHENLMKIKNGVYKKMYEQHIGLR